jgi:hypothetical protein
VKFEITRIDASKHKIRSNTRLFVQLIEEYAYGTLCNSLYRFEDGPDLGDAVLDAPAALVIPPFKERRIKSSRVVNDEDDLIDFVVPDFSVQSSGPMRMRFPTAESVQQTPRSRDWSDIINLQIGAAVEATAIEAIDGLSKSETLIVEGENTADEQVNVQTLVEVLPEVRIPDIEEVASALSGFEGAHDPASSHIDGRRRPVWARRVPRHDTILETYERATSRYVKQIPADVPDRFKVQTERLCRTVAFEACTSMLINSNTREQEDSAHLPALDTLHLRSSPLSSPTAATPAPHVDPALAVLRHYTTVPESAATDLSSITVKNILAHLPDKGLHAPESYSHDAIEDSLKRERTQQELEDLDERARRKFERAELRKQKKASQQAKIRNAVTQQNVLVPGLVLTSPQRDPREVQSSQLAPIAVASSQPGFSMTQPERGAHGERRKVVRKEGRARVKGF